MDATEQVRSMFRPLSVVSYHKPLSCLLPRARSSNAPSLHFKSVISIIVPSRQSGLQGRQSVSWQE